MAAQPYGAPRQTWVQKAGKNMDQRLVLGLPVLEARPNVFSRNPGDFSLESEDIDLTLTLDGLQRLLMLRFVLARHVPDINICKVAQELLRTLFIYQKIDTKAWNY